ncbi:uncharacterized protein NECHADRAFT_90172 [Fusarium vanettenii 77-13-4]|uniref:Hsp70 protein n=1 Tax=Fusarium vanettenii (strain ATCC MYA-4622 / CBS 123669 / FGSC 9596 / NRRL 45880 / 77-13-4) TaxID=660122 RepID=C7YHI0_FUSV7|nr:uncharacterized protein NECHADRAFT_90172 [Fusarium vanettenii 77-13-4]EEU48642.1 hypothetical protein NECHADRAFT_90172 [Fusarium vanettenii 77-13-4]
MAASQPTEDAIVIGIDFGTTYSGVAWAYSREPNDIAIVTSWEAELNHCSDKEKAPTQLWYNSNNDVTWGYSIPADNDALKWFKLLLLKRGDIPADIAASEQLATARRLQEATGKQPLLNKSKFHVVITLPAIWPPYAQRLMKQAAGLSGILTPRPCGATTVRFVSEPEAAALATIQDLSKRSTIKPDDTIVVCDAGGGTVSHSSSRSVSKEMARALCGGVFLDENFLNLIKSKVPKGAWDQVSKAAEKRFLNDGWEHGIKPQFANQQRTWLVDLPDACNDTPRKLKRRRTFELTSDEILSVFSPIVDKIVSLVRRQCDAIERKYSQPPKHIVLVGGFGRCRYLFDRLQTEFESSVLQAQGSKPWTAICRGAVVHELSKQNFSADISVKVEARIARMSYGICHNSSFDDLKHLQTDKYWCDKERKYLAKNQMTWFLKEGDDITSRRPVRYPFYRLLSESVGYVREDIHCSASYPAPSRNDHTVERMCQIKWNRHIRVESLPKYTNPIGEVYHELNYTVEMACEDGTVDFVVYHDGVRVGAQSVEVEFD